MNSPSLTYIYVSTLMPKINGYNRSCGIQLQLTFIQIAQSISLLHHLLLHWICLYAVVFFSSRKETNYISSLFSSLLFYIFFPFKKKENVVYLFINWPNYWWNQTSPLEWWIERNKLLTKEKLKEFVALLQNFLVDF